MRLEGRGGPVAHTPGAIGYSGMGFARPGVKMLKISKRKGGPAVAPTVENATKKKDGYPITRPLLIYTAGEPTGEVQAVSRLDSRQGRPRGRADTGFRAEKRP